MPATVELAAGEARLRVAPEQGGSIERFTWRGRDVLRAAPPACYPLVPYSNRIRDARLAFAGRTYDLARNFGDHPHSIHGVGWQRSWHVLGQKDRYLQIELLHELPDEAWPWPFRAVQTFALAPHALQVTLLIESRAEEPFPFGLGWHPFFPKSPQTRLRFGAQSVWRNDATQIPAERVPIPPEWRFEEERPLGDVVLDQVFNGWAGSAMVAQPEGGVDVEVLADRACGRLVVYAPAQRDFVALEPVTHETNAFNRAAEGADNTGMRTLPAGGSYSCTMRLQIMPR